MEKITRVPHHELKGFGETRLTNAIEVEFTAVNTDVEVAHELVSREPVGWQLIECTDTATPPNPIACGKVYRGNATTKDPKVYINLRSDTIMKCKLRFL